MRALSITFFILLIFSVPILAQSKKEQKEIKKAAEQKDAKSLVLSKKYEFVGRFALPQKGGQIDLATRANSLKVIESIAKANLPYFGRAFSGGYGVGDGGINFESPVQNYKIEENIKKHSLTVSFTAKGKGESYSCTLQVWGLQSATLLITGNNRQPIRYNGILKALNEDE